MTTKCRVCGNEHAGGCAQFFSAGGSRVTQSTKPKRAAARAVSQPIPNVPNKAAQRTAAWREANAEKHREYMRGLMRSRRAARRAQEAKA